MGRNRIVVLGFVLATVLFMGCLGRSPEVAHYMLGAAAPLGTAVPTADEGSANSATMETVASELAVVVGPVRLPAYLERSQIARLESDGKVELDEFSRWLGGFEANFLRALSLGLADRLDSVRVTAAPSRPPYPIDHRVRLHVDDMIRSPEGPLRVRIRWAIDSGSVAADAASERPAPALALFESAYPVAGDSRAAIVAAHDRALADLAAQIARALSRRADSAADSAW